MCKSNNMIGELKKKKNVVRHHLDSNPRSRDSKTKVQAIRPWRYIDIVFKFIDLKLHNDTLSLNDFLF